MDATPNESDFQNLITVLKETGAISEECVQKLRNICKTHEIAAKTDVRTLLTKGIGFALVLNGLVFLSYQVKNDKEFVKSFCAEGTLFGDLPFAETGMQFYVTTLEPTRLIVVEISDFKTMLASHEDLRHLAALFGQKLAMKKAKRERSLLTLSAQERFEEFITDYPGLATRIPQKLVAAYLGITPEALSRLRAKKGRNKRDR